MNWASPEEKGRKINGCLTVVKGTASRMGFASGAQQLPNNLEQKNYNNTDEERARAFRGSGAVSAQTNKQKPQKNTNLKQNKALKETLRFHCSGKWSR